ncbi:MAG: hypothetical protein K2M46_02630 [Lachnospiraceae bacterium]|nr:hypothetical protein [Lachnospiraceae bacterium]
MKKKTGYILAYVIIGVLLVIMVLATGSYGLSKENLSIYGQALELESQMAEKTFLDYRITQFPIAFFDGDYDYVITKEKEELQVKKRKPVMQTFVGTAYWVEDHYEILMPTIEKFSSMIDMLYSADNLSNISQEESALDETTYGSKEQIATIYHEGFHAYQFSNYEEQISAQLKGHTFDDEHFGEALIVEKIDNDEEQTRLYHQELVLLKKMVNSDNIEEIKELLKEYLKKDEVRRQKLTEETLILENYYELVEGSAYYVESIAYEQVYDNEKLQNTYIEPMDVFSKGSHKYYNMGMAKCRILDKLDPEWKNQFDFSMGLTEKLTEYVR